VLEDTVPLGIRASRRNLFAGAAAATGAAVVGTSGVAGSAYIWRDVEIVGGGFVPGIVVNPRERGLVYARTTSVARTGSTTGETAT
jgi:hypothetical protein